MSNKNNNKEERAERNAALHETSKLETNSKSHDEHRPTVTIVPDSSGDRERVAHLADSMRKIVNLRHDLDVTSRISEIIRERRKGVVTRVQPGAHPDPMTERSETISRILNASYLGEKAESVMMQLAVDDITRALRGNDDKVEVDLPGRHKMRFNLRCLDYERFQRTVVLPLGELRDLTSSEKEKIVSYMRLIVSRITAMSPIPSQLLKEVAISLLSHRSPDDVESQFEDVSEVVDEVVNASEEARRRFIIQTLIQPLYRDVLLKRDELSWPSVDDLIPMASAYNRWQSMSKAGAWLPAIRAEVTSSISADKYVGGIIALREATALGIPINAVHGLASLKDVQSADDNQGANFADCESSIINAGGNYVERMSLSTSFGRLERDAVVYDILTQPLVISDRFESDISDTHMSIEEITRAIVALARLNSVQLTSEVSLEFLTAYPEWSGLLVTDDSLQGARLDDLIPSWCRERFLYDFYVSLLNGEPADSSVMRIFSEANTSDLQKAFEPGLYCYSLAYKVLNNLLRQYLTAAKNSFEYHHSAIWKHLEALNLFSVDTLSASYKEGFVAELRANMPVVLPNGNSMYLCNYFIDPSFFSKDPNLSASLSALYELGAIGEMRVDIVMERSFSGSGFTFVDILGLVDKARVLPPSLIKKMAGSLNLVNYRELRQIANTLDRSINVNLMNRDFNSDGELVDGTAVLCEVTPTIIVSFDDISREDRLRYAFVDESVDQTGSQDVTMEDLLHFDPAQRLVRKPLDPSPYVMIRSTSVSLAGKLPETVLPSSMDSLKLNMVRWSHSTEQDLNGNLTS